MVIPLSSVESFSSSLMNDFEGISSWAQDDMRRRKERNIDRFNLDQG